MSGKEAEDLSKRKEKEKRSVRVKRIIKELMPLTLEETFNRWTEELPKKEVEFEPVENAIKKAGEALILNRNSDGGWGRFRGNKSDLWNTAFIVDCLLRVYRYEDIKEQMEGSVEYIVGCCESFLENVDENEEKKDLNKTTSRTEKNKKEEYEIPNNYALAHSLYVLLKTKNKTYESLAQKILNYLISIENPDGGWGWDQFSSSNIYGTAIVVYALMDALESIPKEREERGKIKDRLSNGISWIVKDQNRDGGWGSERGSDPKHTSLALLTILRLFENHGDLKNIIEKKVSKNLNKCIKMEKSVDRGFDWLCLEWPDHSTSRLFSVQSKIPEKGWRVEDSRHVNRVGFESTAYALYTLIAHEEFVEKKEKEKEKEEKKEKKEKRRENFMEGLLWLLYSQERNGYWHKYETEDGKMGGSCHNFYLALGIQILSLCNQKLAGNKDTDFFSTEIKKRNLVLLAKLSRLKDSKLITKPKKPFFAGSHPISVVMSYSVTLATAAAIILALILLYLRREDIKSFLSDPPYFVKYVFFNPKLLIAMIIV